MKAKLLLVLGSVWIVSATPAAAPDDPRQSLFSRDALRRAVATLDARTDSRQDPSGDWARVRGMVGVEVMISTVGVPQRRVAILAADDATVTVRLRDGGRTRLEILQIPRSDVLEIKRWIRRGSVVGAVAGTIAGLVVGYYGFLGASYSQCGGSCVDQAVMAIGSLTGFPIAGGLVGYHAFGRRLLTTVYVRPVS
jgi:hypothetical protein